MVSQGVSTRLATQQIVLHQSQCLQVITMLHNDSSNWEREISGMLCQLQKSFFFNDKLIMSCHAPSLAFNGSKMHPVTYSFPPRSTECIGSSSSSPFFFILFLAATQSPQRESDLRSCGMLCQLQNHSSSMTKLLCHAHAPFCLSM